MSVNILWGLKHNIDLCGRPFSQVWLCRWPSDKSSHQQCLETQVCRRRLVSSDRSDGIGLEPECPTVDSEESTAVDNGNQQRSQKKLWQLICHVKDHSNVEPVSSTEMLISHVTVINRKVGA